MRRYWRRRRSASRRRRFSSTRTARITLAAVLVVIRIEIIFLVLSHGGVSSSSCGVVRGASGDGFSREIPAGNFGSIQTRRRLYARRRHCRCLFRRIDVHFVTLFEKFERFAILDGIDKIFKLFQQVRDEVPHVFASHEIDEL